MVHQEDSGDRKMGGMKIKREMDKRITGVKISCEKEND